MVLATGMAGRSSHLGARIEMLLESAREFTPRASATWVATSTTILLTFAIACAQAPRWLAFAQSPRSPVRILPVRQGPLMVRYAPSQQRAVVNRRMEFVDTPGVVTPPNGGSFLAALVAAGYGDLSVDEIINLKNAGVSPQYLSAISQSGMGKLSTQEIIDLCHHGVTPEYVRKVGQAGIRDLAFREIMELASRGVRPEAIQEIHAMGFGPYNARQTMELAQVGMRPSLFRALKDYGLVSAPIQDILDAHRSGLDARNVSEARQYGPSLTLKQIIRLKTAGVI